MNVAERFAQSLRDVAAEEGASTERVDEFLDDLGALMVRSVLYH